MVMIKQSINYKNPTDVSQDLSLQVRKNRKWWKRMSMSDTSIEEKLSQKINQRQRYEKKKIEYSSSHLFHINSNINKFSKRESNYRKRSPNLSFDLTEKNRRFTFLEFNIFLSRGRDLFEITRIYIYIGAILYAKISREVGTQMGRPRFDRAFSPRLL